MEEVLWSPMRCQDSEAVKIQHLTHANSTHGSAWHRMLTYDQEWWNKSDGNSSAKMMPKHKKPWPHSNDTNRAAVGVAPICEKFWKNGWSGLDTAGQNVRKKFVTLKESENSWWHFKKRTVYLVTLTFFFRSLALRFWYFWHAGERK